MIGRAIYKVPQGKMLRVTLDFDEKINSVRLTGDFFIYPEEENESIEKSVSGMEFDRAKLIAVIENTIKNRKIELFGLNAEAIVEGIYLAKEGKK